MPQILAFDIGVKNLAFAVYDTSGSNVIALENHNILAEANDSGGAESSEVITCYMCSSKASYQVMIMPSLLDSPSHTLKKVKKSKKSAATASTAAIAATAAIHAVSSTASLASLISFGSSTSNDNTIIIPSHSHPKRPSGFLPVCRRHIPVTHAILSDDSKKAFTKLPPMPILKSIAKAHNLKSTGKKNQIIESLQTRFAIPIEQPKTVKVAQQSLTALHDAIRKFVDASWPKFRDSDEVLLENQPAFKNPHMKSVQVLLFAALREKFICNLPHPPPFHLVHAKKKVKDAKKGDEGYAERKRGSEERIQQLFESSTIHGDEHYSAWSKAKKKSDMADALCMCIDWCSSG